MNLFTDSNNDNYLVKANSSELSLDNSLNNYDLELTNIDENRIKNILNYEINRIKKLCNDVNNKSNDSLYNDIQIRNIKKNDDILINYDKKRISPSKYFEEINRKNKLLGKIKNKMLSNNN